MTASPDIFCIGAAHWDIIGHSLLLSGPGQDVPGTVRHSPGGVALNVAMGLARHGLSTSLIAVLGRDRAGDDLAARMRAAGVGTAHLVRSATCATDCYLAIEGAAGLIGAIATSQAVESLTADALGVIEDNPHALVLLDSGLATTMLAALPRAIWLGRAGLCLTAASPAKATRLAPFLDHPRATFYLNLAEAGALCGTEFTDSRAAAKALIDKGAAHVLVTDGPGVATDGSAHGLVSAAPPPVNALRATGAGDAFTAAHIAACSAGLAPGPALQAALSAACAHVSTAEPDSQRTP